MTELISVMIVDDEKLMLEDLSTMINWEAYGYQIIACLLYTSPSPRDRG